MGTIYIVGLGPTDENELTLAAVERIKSSDTHLLRTKMHDAVKYFDRNGIKYRSFDDYYESAENFAQLYERIADEVVKLAGDEDVNYYVPGNPRVAEKTVELILRKHDDVRIISGMSFIEPVIEAVGVDIADGFKIIDADDYKKTDLSIHDNILAVQVYDEFILGDLKIDVSEIYGDYHECVIISDAGIKDKMKISCMPICRLGEDFELNHQTSVFIPKAADDIYDYADLVNIVERLRGEGGCPWDMEQTHESIKHALIEEAYELIETIDDGDYEHMIEELGDLLLQIVFHMSIGYEEGEFLPIEVTTRIVDKLIYRHPHVFGELKISDSAEVLDNWDELKKKERNIESFTDVLNDVPRLPSLMMAQKYSKRMMKLGFKWDSIEGAIEKIDEELSEFKEAYKKGESMDKIAGELGDLLFSVCNVGEYLGVDLELTLNKILKKILKRFDIMENLANNRGINLNESNLEVMDELWEEAKSSE